MDLATLEAEVQHCSACGLAATRTHTVFGKGSPTATVLFIGEGPGADEDKQGQPFVGRAGQLLDRIIQAAELPRDDIYICNVVKCRPPGNRTPARDEIIACTNFWQQQLALIQPEIVVALGAVALQALVSPEARITRDRGVWVEREHYRIMPTFHPAALLRDESKKRPVWEDMKLVRDAYRALKGIRTEREIWPPQNHEVDAPLEK